MGLTNLIGGVEIELQLVAEIGNLGVVEHAVVFSLLVSFEDVGGVHLDALLVQTLELVKGSNGVLGSSGIAICCRVLICGIIRYLSPAGNGSIGTTEGTIGGSVGRSLDPFDKVNKKVLVTTVTLIENFGQLEDHALIVEGKRLVGLGISDLVWETHGSKLMVLAFIRRSAVEIDCTNAATNTLR